MIGYICVCTHICCDIMMSVSLFQEILQLEVLLSERKLFLRKDTFLGPEENGIAERRALSKLQCWDCCFEVGMFLMIQLFIALMTSASSLLFLEGHTLFHFGFQSQSELERLD